MNASGFYSGQDVKMLFVLAKQRQAPAIFRLISEIDPHAFVSQSAVIGVYGEGFDKIKYKSKKSTEFNIPCFLCYNEKFPNLLEIVG